MGGWILAEISMVLVMVVLGSQFVTPPANDPVATPPPTPTAPATKLGISNEYKTCDVRMANGTDTAAARLLHECIMTKGQGRRPGLILLFGVAWSTKRPTSGEEVSGPMAELLTPMFGDDVPVMRSLMRSTLNHPTGKVMAEIFYFA